MAEAQERLKAEGWRPFFYVSYPYSNWLVCDQYPDKEAGLAEGRTIGGWYSMSLDVGPNCDPVVLPRFVGGSAADVTRWQNRVGVFVDIENNDPKRRPEADDWVVCNQIPKPGAAIRGANDDTVWVSIKPPNEC